MLGRMWNRITGLLRKIGVMKDRRSVWLDSDRHPPGWDEDERRVHHVSVAPGGVLVHHETCWCWRFPNTVNDLMNGRTIKGFEGMEK